MHVIPKKVGHVSERQLSYDLGKKVVWVCSLLAFIASTIRALMRPLISNIGSSASLWSIVSLSLKKLRRKRLQCAGTLRGFRRFRANDYPSERQEHAYIDPCGASRRRLCAAGRRCNPSGQGRSLWHGDSRQGRCYRRWSGRPWRCARHGDGSAGRGQRRGLPLHARHPLPLVQPDGLIAPSGACPLAEPRGLALTG
jgi:hypothetical protein